MQKCFFYLFFFCVWVWWRVKRLSSESSCVCDGESAHAFWALLKTDFSAALLWNHTRLLRPLTEYFARSGGWCYRSHQRHAKSLQHFCCKGLHGKLKSFTKSNVTAMWLHWHHFHALLSHNTPMADVLRWDLRVACRNTNMCKELQWHFSVRMSTLWFAHKSHVPRVRITKMLFSSRAVSQYQQPEHSDRSEVMYAGGSERRKGK